MSSCQIVWKSVKPLLRYSNVMIFFKDGSHLASWICGQEFVRPTNSTWCSLSLCKIWLESVEKFRSINERMARRSLQDRVEPVVDSCSWPKVTIT